MSLFPYENPTPPKGGQRQPPPVAMFEMVPDRFEEEAPADSGRRINLKVFVTLVVVFILTPVGFFTLASYQDQRLRKMALAQAKESAEKGQIDQAVLGLSHYLKSWPEDVTGLELMAKLRTEGARSLDELMAAAEAQDLLIRVDPMGPGRQENRRKLIDLYIRWSDGIRMASLRQQSSVDKTENRSRAAVKVAEQMMAFGADDAESHRLMAMALESLAATGDAKALLESTVEYEKALRRDPGDVAAAERLAQIVYDRGNETAGSDEILEELLRAKPNSPEARLTRYRFFARTNRFDRARVELDRALKLAPTSVEVRLSAASEALQNRDPALARRHLDAIAAGSQSDRRILLLRGFIELSEKHPEVAVDTWREGLLSTGGGDRELTWRLAYTLVQLGRFTEAEPLIGQYRRLSSQDDPMLHFLQGVRDEMTGRPSAAIAELEKLRPSVDKGWHPEIALALGRCYERINDDPRAMVEYRQASKGSPRSIQAWRSLARLIKKSNPDDAARELEAGLGRLPGETTLLLDLATIRLEQQLAKPPSERDWSKVNNVLDRAKSTGRADPGVIKLRAEILSSTGRFEEALGLLANAAEGPVGSRDELWLCWSNGLASRGRLDEALKVLERGSSPEKAGDHASLRIARANLMLQVGQGRAARDLLTRGVETLPHLEQVALAKARARVFQVLGDLAGAREACQEWAKLAPLEPDPGLELLDMARQNGDDKMTRLGLEMLRSVGGADEPYGLAARTLDLLLSNRTMDETRTARLEKAGELSQKLSAIAPRLPVSRLVRGMVLERNHRIPEAIVDYLAALDGKTAEMALSRLTFLYTKLRRFDDLAALKERVKSSTAIDQVAARMAIEQGDKYLAQKLVTRLVDGQADNLQVHEIQARLLRELGKPEAAEESLRDLVQRDRNRADAWVALVTFQINQGASSEAAKTIDRAKDEYMGEYPDLLMARLRFIAGDRDGAGKLYDEATTRFPEDLVTYQAACDFAEVTGRPDRAEALARRALGVKSCSAWAARALAIMLSKRPDPASWNEAWALISPGGPGAGDSPGDRLLRASLLAQSPDPARRAETPAVLTALIEDLPASNPIGIRARINLATLLLQTGKPEEAAKIIGIATEESVAADPATLALAVEALARAGQPDEAEQRLNRLAAIEPKSARVASARAWVFQARGKPEEAVATIENAASDVEKADDGEPRNVLFFKQLISMKQLDAAEKLGRKIARLWPRSAWVPAELFAAQGRIDEALDSCRAAVEAGATREPLKLALALVINGRLDRPQGEKARAIAETVVSGHPGDAALTDLAIALANRQGRFDDAVKICRGALEANPSNPIFLNQLNDMAWILCEFLDRPADALVQVDRVLKLKSFTTAMDTRGVILTRLGRFDEAIKELERCVQKEPVGNRFLHLARAYQQAGKLEQYRSTLDRAKKAGINPATLGPKERAEFAAVIGP